MAPRRWEDARAKALSERVTSLLGESGIITRVAGKSGLVQLVAADVSGVASAADKLPYFTGSGTASVADFTSTARSLLDDTSVGAMRTTLGALAKVDTEARAALNSLLAKLRTLGLIAT